MDISRPRWWMDQTRGEDFRASLIGHRNQGKCYITIKLILFNDIKCSFSHLPDTSFSDANNSISQIPMWAVNGMLYSCTN